MAASPSPKHVLVLQGHPDPAGGHLGHALADAYAEGARAAGHAVERVDIARLDFPLLRSAAEFEDGRPPADVAAAQAAIRRADHLVLVFPLWMGDAPALVKGFFEQAFRPGFAVEERTGRMPVPKLAGRSARIVVTMGMPAPAYRFLYRAHAVKALERNLLGMAGVRPVRATLLGLVETASEARRAGWLADLRSLGARAI